MDELKRHHIKAKPTLENEQARTMAPKIPGPAQAPDPFTYILYSQDTRYVSIHCYDSVIHDPEADAGFEPEGDQRSSQIFVRWNPNVGP